MQLQTVSTEIQIKYKLKILEFELLEGKVQLKVVKKNFYK